MIDHDNQNRLEHEKENTNMKLIKLVVLASVLCVSGACVGEEDEALCDPSGVFNVIMTRISGGCADSLSDSLTISETSTSWLVTDGDGNGYTGTIAQGPGLCTLSLGTYSVDGDYSATLDYELNIVDSSMTGRAFLVFYDDSGIPPDLSCSSEYSVSGQRL
jgi:hypothetical protein